jgi:hypothetical protein
VAKPTNTGGTVKRTPTIDPESIPNWQRPSTETLESAASEKRALVIYFPEENSTDADFSSKELAELSKTDAVFVKIPYTADREASPWAEDSAVPTSKLLSDNPSREYDVTVGKSTVIVADSYGNEYYRLSKEPNADQLKAYIDRVKDQAEKATEKLQKNLDKAKTYLDKEDRKNAVKYLLKNFDEDLVGLDPQEESIRMYHEILDAARSELATMVEKKDADGIKNLAKEFRKTDMESEIDEALDSVK